MPSEKDIDINNEILKIMKKINDNPLSIHLLLKLPLTKLQLKQQYKNIIKTNLQIYINFYEQNIDIFIKEISLIKSNCELHSKFKNINKWIDYIKKNPLNYAQLPTSIKNRKKIQLISSNQYDIWSSYLKQTYELPHNDSRLYDTAPPNIKSDIEICYNTILNILPSIGESHYQSKLSKIKINYKLAKQYATTEDWLYQNVFRLE